jgi:hypothetical protein
MAMSRTTWPSARHRDDERVVADARIGRAPRREVGQRVGPAEADQTRIGRLPPVRAGAHPVIGVAQRHAADAVLPAEDDRPGHRLERVQVAGTAVAVPPLERAVGADPLGPGTDVHDPAGDHPHEAGEPVQAVGVNPVP